MLPRSFHSSPAWTADPRGRRAAVGLCVLVVGVVATDPEGLPAGGVAPAVGLERMVTMERAAAGESAPGLGVPQRDPGIDYAAVSFLVPGVWTDEDTSIALRLATWFRETPGVLLLGLLSFGVVVAAGYRWRVGTLRRRERELTRLVEERTADLRRHGRQLEERNARLTSQAKQLAELHDARSRLFANLSHELRTPLTLVLGPLHGLRAGRHGPMRPIMREQLDLMARSGERALGLVNQILDLSRLKAGALSLKRTTADLVHLARATTAAFASLAEGRGIDLRFRTDLADLPCAFDPEQLEKVLLNLLSNAVKFTGTGGAVEVVVRAAGPWAEIVVKDTGVGIAPDELPRIFDRFYRADSASTPRYPGTGIGLTLAKELVELHGGDIRAASRPGAGSAFTIRLPVTTPTDGTEGAPGGADAPRNDLPHAVLPVPPPIDETAPAVSRAGTPDGDRTTVLLVDDNADVRAYLRSILERRYRVREARDGEEGLEAARTGLPDLVVADVIMPRLDGLALGRALKQDPLTDAIPLVLLTARAAPEDHVRGLEHGADAYLVKPFHPGVLEACVTSLLNQRRSLRERFRQGRAAPPTTRSDANAALDRRLRSLVEARLADPDFGPKALAAAAALSYHQLYRGLRDELGITPSGFIRRVRVECAAELLRQSAGSVTEVAYSVGFESLSYFRRAFHERFHASPTRYMAAAPRPDARP